MSLIYRQPSCILPLSFFEGRFIPDLHPDSLEYEQWWEEQTTRCLDGWTDGGFTATGPYYYHLNFKKINLVDEFGRPLIEHPFYSEEDQQIFNDFAFARKVKKAFMLITGRGFGKSFDVATICEHEFTFYDAAEIIVSASVDLYATELWQKIELGLNSQPDDIRLNLLVDKPDFKQAGSKILQNGKTRKELGSKMRKVVYDDDAGRTRGTRPNIHVWEEVGAWTGAAKLEDCINQTEASWWRGSQFMCMPIFIGTGGMMKKGGSKDARKIGLNPDSHNILSFEYMGQKTCKFYPSYIKYGGFYEETGVSDVVGAKADLDRRREEKKGDIEAYRQFCQEQPYNIFEAFEESGSSNFDKVKLETQYNLIMRTPSLQALVERGTLIPVMAGDLVVDVKFQPDPRGEFEFLRSEHPRKDTDGNPIKNLYISGCDSFDAAEDEVRPELSPGCIRMFKRLWNANETGRMFVAGLTIRTKNGSEFYFKTLLLNMYYGSKMLYEHTNKGLPQWYIANKVAQKYLYPRPTLDKEAVKKQGNSNLYGIAMPGPVKVVAIGGYREYIEHYSTQMWFPTQLKDAMDFRYGSPEFHETMASSLALMGDIDMHNLKIQEIKKESVSFPKFVRDGRGNLVFS